jgi:hypothetical protein
MDKKNHIFFLMRLLSWRNDGEIIMSYELAYAEVIAISLLLLVWGCWH